MTPLVLIHGLNGNAADMEVFNAAAPAGMQILTPTLLGHGGRPTDKQYGPRALVNDVIASMNDAGIGRAHLLGYSFGGHIGLQLARFFPNRVASLTTVATKVGHAEKTIAFMRYLTDPERLARLGEDGVGRQAARHAPADWRAVARNNIEMYERLHRRQMTTADLAAIEPPVLMIGGEGDPIVSPDETRKVAELIPAGEFKCLSQPGHPLRELPVDLVNAWVRPFIERAEAAERTRPAQAAAAAAQMQAG